MVSKLLALLALAMLSGCATDDGKIYSFKKKFDANIGFEQAKAQCEYEKHLQYKADVRADKASNDWALFIQGKQNPTYLACMGRFGYAWELDKDQTELNQAHKLYLNKEYEKSFEQYKVVANRGNPTAQSWIGFFYENGLGVTKNFKESFNWHEQSAIQGMRTSQARVSYFYLYGAGVSKDIVKAYFWGALAKENGENIDLSLYKNSMTGNELDEANQKLNRCKTIGLKNCAL